VTIEHESVSAAEGPSDCIQRLLTGVEQEQNRSRTAGSCERFD
jgi:hypothetical protein